VVDAGDRRQGTPASGSGWDELYFKSGCGRGPAASRSVDGNFKVVAKNYLVTAAVGGKSQLCTSANCLLVDQLLHDIASFR
jgi:hypothetical protein